ncbi:MAG: hypothetical protein HFE77_04375 [Clostridiales bacterium]|nr:hypothetical protein [Clostridiales bacterium]
MMLFIQECKKIVGAIPYWLFVAAMLLALFSQGVFHFVGEPLQEPEPGGHYGTKQEENPAIIMPAAFSRLWSEFCANDYTTYPIGIVKHIKLSSNKQDKMAEIFSELTGISKDEVLQRRQETAVASHDSGDAAFQIGENSMQQQEDGSFTIASEKSENRTSKENLTIRDDMNYVDFRRLMQQADDLLGGGSDYAAKNLISYGTVPLTYEEAKERYELAVNKDHITSGYARLFADYAGVMVLSILPVFLAVVLCMKDRRSKMQALIYTKRASSAKIILIRYLALLATVMLPVIMFSYLSNIPIWSAYKGITLDYLAPLTYAFDWLLPSVMISTAVGMFLTELTGTPAAVAVQSLWWLLDTNMGIQSVQAGYGLFRLAPRHNAGAKSYFRTQDYLDHWENLIQNRLLLVGLSLLLIVCTILIYEKKRKGFLGENKFFQKAFFRIRDRSH